MRFGSFLKVFSETILIFGFFVVGFYMVLSIYGYKYDSINNDFEKLSIIDLGGDFKGVSVFLDGILVSDKLPFTIRGVDPGIHNISVQKQDFYTYNATLSVNKDIVSKIDSIILMPNNIVFEKIDDTGLDFSVKDVDGKIAYTSGSDIWVDDVSGGNRIFVSRSFAPINDIKLFSDEYSLIFARNDKFNFCDHIMQNCYVLRDYKEGDSFISKDGKIFYKEKSGSVYLFDILKKTFIYAF